MPAVKKSVRLRPIGDYVVIKPDVEDDVSKGGIYIPEVAQEESYTGTVVAVGSGVLTQRGDRVPSELKEGDRIRFSGYGHEIELDEEKFLVIREFDCIAIME